MCRRASGILAVVLAIVLFSPQAGGGEIPAVLSLKEPAEVCDHWLSVRLEKILPELMRRENIDMWLVICEEYNEDPVDLSVVPFASLSARRQTELHLIK
jgi:hypothetical protein